MYLDLIIFDFCYSRDNINIEIFLINKLKFESYF